MSISEAILNEVMPHLESRLDELVTCRLEGIETESKGVLVYAKTGKPFLEVKDLMAFMGWSRQTADYHMTKDPSFPSVAKSCNGDGSRIVSMSALVNWVNNPKFMEVAK